MANLVYDVHEKPKFGQLMIYAFQQLLAIIAATILVPVLIGIGDHMNAALLGAGIGTLLYILITKKKSPVMLSSSFAYIGALTLAYQGYGFLGILLGGFFSGLVYIVISIIIKFVGTKWIENLLPPIVIGPVVMLIGLSLSVSAVSNLLSANNYFYVDAGGSAVHPYNLIALLCGLVAFFVVVFCTLQGKSDKMKAIPFLLGIIAGYVLAGIFSAIGYAADVPYLKIIDFSPLVDNFKNISVTSFIDYPRIILYEGIKEIVDSNVKLTGVGVAEIALAFIPMSLVSFSEHVADHKNLSSVIGHDLVNDEPGLSRTVMGDGVGNITGTFFGVCPNTTYGESVGCVAITRNASVVTTIATAILCVVLAFVTPVTAVLRTIPTCVMGGICLALYGFIAASGLKMLKGLEVAEGKNLFALSVILVSGLGGLALQIPYQFGLITEDFTGALRWIEVGAIGFALILGIITYKFASFVERKTGVKEEQVEKGNE